MVEWTSKWVWARLKQLFPEHQWAKASTLLDDYDGDSESGTSRVQLAILKASKGKIELLPALIAEAKADYRDIICWAEYQNEINTTLGADPNAGDLNVEQAREKDVQDYKAWLYNTEPTEI